MRLSKKTIFILALTVLIFVSLIYFYVLPVATTVYSDIKRYETRTAYRDDYTNFTTPLSKDVVDDICAKLNIEKTSKNCLPGAVVYGPDFFDDIREYFQNISSQPSTDSIVREKLEEYEVACSSLIKTGNGFEYYECDYDLSSDGIYHIVFLFYKDGRIFRIMDNRGGS